jgi:hypothetical protein
MIWLCFTVFLIGCGLTLRLARWRSRHTYTAAAGTLLAALVILTGFSIGFVVAPVALLVIAAAVVPHLKP